MSSDCYHTNCLETQGIAATIFTLAITIRRLRTLTSLRDSSKISINFKRALTLAIAKQNDYISELRDSLTSETHIDPTQVDYVKNIITNPIFRRFIFGDDKTVTTKMLNGAALKSSITINSINKSVNNSISNDLNSTDPITKIAISYTFDGNQTSNSDYYKEGYAFGNVPYYGSKTTFTLDSANNITILSDGDPYPALAGTPIFTNNGTTARTFGVIKSYFVEQWYNYTFPYRGGTNTGANNVVFYQVSSNQGMGIQGVFANGCALYNPSSGFSVPGADISANVPGGKKYAFNAIFFENEYGIDDAGGHPSEQGMPNSKNVQGQYHYHDSMFLSSDAWNNSVFLNSNSYYSTTNYNCDYIRNSDGHSKIIAILFDGYPVYGPYGYSDATDASSSVTRMTSSYTTWSDPFDGRPYTYTDIVYTNNGTPIEMSAGAYLNDYYYVDGLGTLDIHNGRYCVTPEYPNGTYAYFATIDDRGNPVFPYFVGQYSKQSLNVTNNGYKGK
jgi:hypothetical protein